MNREPTEQFMHVRDAAPLLGVPSAWLTREAHDGRIPCLHVGRRMLVDVAQVREALAKRAEMAVANGE